MSSLIWLVWCRVGDFVTPPSDPLAAAIERAGLSDVPTLSLVGDEDRYLGFFEAHIEQGPALEASATSIGVVSACVGIFGGDIFFAGQQNHAGTTPMELRQDAGMGAIVFGSWVNDALKQLNPLVWTFGDVEFGTHSHSTVPGYARLRLQWRDASLDLLEAAKARVLGLVDQMNERWDEFRLRVTTTLRPEDGETGAASRPRSCPHRCLHVASWPQDPGDSPVQYQCAQSAGMFGV